MSHVSDRSSFTQTFQINVAPAASPVHVSVCLWHVFKVQKSSLYTFSGVSLGVSGCQVRSPNFLDMLDTLDAGYMRAYSLPLKWRKCTCLVFWLIQSPGVTQPPLTHPASNLWAQIFEKMRYRRHIKRGKGMSGVAPRRFKPAAQQRLNSGFSTSVMYTKQTKRT